MEHSKAQTALMAKDAELERKNVEIGSLQADKAGLDKLLQVGPTAGMIHAALQLGTRGSSPRQLPPLRCGSRCSRGAWRRDESQPCMLHA